MLFQWLEFQESHFLTCWDNQSAKQFNEAFAAWNRAGRDVSGGTACPVPSSLNYISPDGQKQNPPFSKSPYRVLKGFVSAVCYMSKEQRLPHTSISALLQDLNVQLAPAINEVAGGTLCRTLQLTMGLGTALLPPALAWCCWTLESRRISQARANIVYSLLGEILDVVAGKILFVHAPISASFTLIWDGLCNSVEEHPLTPWLLRHLVSSSWPTEGRSFAQHLTKLHQ